MTAHRHGRARPRWRRWLVAAVGAWAVVIPRHAAGQPAPSPSEDQIRAAYVFNFASFVTWPPAAFGSPRAPLVIGVAPRSRLEAHLEQVVSGQAMQGHPLVVRPVRRPGELAGCHILVMDGLAATEFNAWLGAVREAPVLTVGDDEDFLAAGGIVRFVSAEGRVVFDVNMAAADRAALQVSARLLKVARRVYGAREDQ